MFGRRRRKKQNKSWFFLLLSIFGAKALIKKFDLDK